MNETLITYGLCETQVLETIDSIDNRIKYVIWLLVVIALHLYTQYLTKRIQAPTLVNGLEDSQKSKISGTSRTKVREMFQSSLKEEKK